MRQRGPIML